MTRPNAERFTADERRLILDLVLYVKGLGTPASPEFRARVIAVIRKILVDMDAVLAWRDLLAESGIDSLDRPAMDEVVHERVDAPVLHNRLEDLELEDLLNLTLDSDWLFMLHGEIIPEFADAWEAELIAVGERVLGDDYVAPLRVMDPEEDVDEQDAEFLTMNDLWADQVDDSQPLPLLANARHAANAAEPADETIWLLNDRCPDAIRDRYFGSTTMALRISVVRMDKGETMSLVMRLNMEPVNPGLIITLVFPDESVADFVFATHRRDSTNQVEIAINHWPKNHSGFSLKLR